MVVVLLASVAFAQPPSVVDVAGGRDFGCAVLDDGSVWCVGANDEGQLGLEANSSDVMVRVPGITGAVLVAAGRNHALALLSDGSVVGWGENSFGRVAPLELAYGPIAPTRVVLPRKAVLVAAAEYHSCAVLDDGSVWCWGRNQEGELGFGEIAPVGGGPVDDLGGLSSSRRPWNVGAEVNAPVAVPGLPGPATAISADGARTAVVIDGEVWWWGAGAFRRSRSGGSVGAGPAHIAADELPPRKLGGLSGIRSVELRDTNGVAVGRDGRLWGWGSGAGAPTWVPRTGPTPYATDEVPPSPYPELEGVAEVALGTGFVCVRFADGSVRCWGAEPSWPRAGIRGDGTRGNSGPPTTVPGVKAWTLAAGDGFVLAARGPALWYWGVVDAPTADEEHPPATATATALGFAP